MHPDAWMQFCVFKMNFFHFWIEQFWPNNWGLSNEKSYLKLPKSSLAQRYWVRIPVNSGNVDVYFNELSGDFWSRFQLCTWNENRRLSISFYFDFCFSDFLSRLFTVGCLSLCSVDLSNNNLDDKGWSFRENAWFLCKWMCSSEFVSEKRVVPF